MITVINPQTGRELWKEVDQPIKWEDWKVKRLVRAKDGSERVEGVDLTAVLARRHIRNVAIIGAIVSLLALYAPQVLPSISGGVFSVLRKVGLLQ